MAITLVGTPDNPERNEDAQLDELLAELQALPVKPLDPRQARRVERLMGEVLIPAMQAREQQPTEE